MKKFLAILLAAMMVLSLFAVCGCNTGKDDEEPEEELPEAVGKWELVTGEDEAERYLKIDEDGDVAGEFVTLMQDAIGVECDFSYDFDDESFDIEYEGITISIDCYADGDFLIIDPEKISEGSDPMILRREGTDADPVEYYYDNFDGDEWSFDYTLADGGDDDDDDDEEDGEVVDIIYTAPDEFVLNEEQSVNGYTIYCLEDLMEGKTTDASNINFANTPSNAVGFDSYTADDFEKQYEETLDVELDVEDFDRVTVAGLDAIRFEISYEVSDVDVVQVQYFIKYGGYVEIFTLTQFGDADWVDEFEDSIEDIELVYE